jgi:glycosyltransferase involved in cell wall biosynthesis
MEANRPLRVLQSFPQRIGAGRTCSIAWHQATSVAAAGGRVRVVAGSVARPLPGGIEVDTTLARGSLRLPFRLVGSRRAIALHDRMVARALPGLAEQIDIVHAWPLGALETLRAAQRLGIPTVLERPNAHTRFAYRVVEEECVRLGIALPPGYEHAYDAAVLRREEAEYELADRLLCPSEFVAHTFREEGFAEERLARHTYGFDDAVFRPGREGRADDGGLTMLFAGLCAVRKGVHFALEAWLRSPASRNGTFLIAGEFLPAYAERLGDLLRHPSVRVLGQRNDVADLMRAADVFILPSVEEGFPLVCAEALGSGCALLVSDASAAACLPGQNGFTHAAGDIDALAAQITALDSDPELLRRLRVGARSSAPRFTWERAGERLLSAYRELSDMRPDPSFAVASV